MLASLHQVFNRSSHHSYSKVEILAAVCCKGSGSCYRIISLLARLMAVIIPIIISSFGDPFHILLIERSAVSDVIVTRQTK